MYDTATYDEDGTFRQNAVEEVNYISAYSVTNFTQDSTAPALTSFELDMDAGELIFNFDEPVRASTLNASRCEILSTGDYNETSTSNNSHWFHMGTYFGGHVQEANGRDIVIELGDKDLDQIKLNGEVAMSASTSWLSCRSGFTDDMAGNAVNIDEVHDRPEILEVSRFRRDQTGPVLEGFDYNLATGNITLEPKWLEPKWLEPKWLEPKWLEPKWLEP